MDYSCGLLFDSTKQYVALIRKKRPIWQFNKLNGGGGKLENDEDFLDCMIRETKEEFGIDQKKWFPISILNIGIHKVKFFAAFDVEIDKIVSMTDEYCEIIKVSDIFDVNSKIYTEIIPDIKTVIALSLDKNSGYEYQEKYWIIF
jgi:8-oxo-dGTP pyrophosphatase MutT (NUDIX family)